MKFVYVEFYDLVYRPGWSEDDLEIEDSLHVGTGIIVEDKPTHITMAMAVGGTDRSNMFSKLMIPRKMIIRLVEIEESAFRDRVLVNGYGNLPDKNEASKCECDDCKRLGKHIEKISNSNNEQKQL